MNTRDVSEIPAGDRQTLEGILGVPLAAGQHLFIVAYTPGAPPDEEVHRSAQDRLEETLATNQSFAEHQGVTPAEADEAIDEAMRQIRRRN